MSITKEAILQASNGGLDVFRYLLPGDWKVGKSFKNPLYQDKKASCYIYLDKVSKVYKIKDFGDPDFAGDCFFLVGKKNFRQLLRQRLELLLHQLALHSDGSSHGVGRSAQDQRGGQDSYTR